MTTEEQQYFMQITVNLSHYTLDRQHDRPFGAIVVKNGNIVGSSSNYEFRDIDPCAHAEVVAIRDACRNLKTLDLTECQIFSFTEPCPMCMAAIYWAQISEIYYGNPENILSFGLTSQNIPDEFQKPQKKRLINFVEIPKKDIHSSKELIIH